MNRWYKIAPAVVLLLALGLGLALGILILRTLSGGPSARAAATPTLIRQIQSLSQLVTVKCVMEKVVILEDVKWYGENRLLLVAHGVVKAGVDLNQLKPDDLQIGDGKAVLRLPRAVITDVYLDETQTRIIERTTGLLRSYDKLMEQSARQVALDDIRRAARNAGLIEEADQRARDFLLRLIRQAGIQDVEFR